MKRTITLAILLAMLASFSGCFTWFYEKAVEKTIETETGGDVEFDISTGEYYYKDEEGNSYAFGENAEVPSDWPDDFPVNKKWDVTNAISSNYDGDIYMSVTQVCSSCSKDDVIEYYKEEMADEGWEEGEYYESESSQWGSTASITFYKDDSRNASVGYYDYGDGEPSITISYDEYNYDDWY